MVILCVGLSGTYCSDGPATSRDRRMGERLRAGLAHGRNGPSGGAVHARCDLPDGAVRGTPPGARGDRGPVGSRARGTGRGLQLPVRGGGGRRRHRRRAPRGRLRRAGAEGLPRPLDHPARRDRPLLPLRGMAVLAGPARVMILADHVQRYLQDLRPPRSPVMQEMEALAEREGIPIVHWETGRLLAIETRALDPRQVLEVGTAIGYST